MKTITIAGGLTAPLAAMSLAALIASAATAQTAPATPEPARHARADTDGDGRISQAEFVQARTGRLATLDADRDGALTAEEVRGRMQTRMAERAGMRFDRLDADKDGAISRAEFDAQRAQRADRAGPHHRGQGLRQRMAGHPTAARPGRQGGDHQARGPVVIAEVQARAAATIARLDADRDGYVTTGERRAVRMSMREHRQERRAERMARRAARPTPASPPAPASE